MTATNIELGPDGVRAGRPQTRFRLPETGASPYVQPSLDGQHFLVYEPVAGTARPDRMVVVQNWAAGLGK